MDWKMLLACITGSVDEDLLLRNEYLITENRILRKQIEGRVQLTDAERQILAEIGKQLDTISDQTVGNILKRRGMPTAPDRKRTTTWREFIRSHMAMLWATDFFSTEVWTLGGLVTFYVLFFIKLKTREVHRAGITAHPNEVWMMQS